MQRDGHSDERTKAGASGRTPPVIEGEAVEVHAPQPAQFENAGAAEVVAAEKDLASESAADEMQATHPQDDAAADEAPASAAAAVAPPAKRSRAPLAILGLIIVGLAGAVAWIATPGHREGDLKSRVIALLPQSAQRALHVTPAPESKTVAAAPDGKDVAASEPSKTETAGAQPAKPEDSKPEASKPEPAKPETNASQAARPAPERTAVAEPAKPAEPADKGVAATPSPAPAASATPTAQTGGMTVIGGPPVAIGVDPRRIEDMSVKIDALQAKMDDLQGKLDAALGRIGDLQSKLELAQGKIDLSQSKSDAAATANAVAQAAQKIEALTQKLAALEQKLEQPKTDTRAPQARENNTPTGREYAASRAVVAQATTEALRAGAPLADNLAALKGLGVADDKIADLSAFSKAGAPTTAQLATQWRGLRDKVIALDAPAAGAGFGDKLLAKAKSVFHVTWAGQGAQSSISSIVARIDMALQRNDLAAAVAACDEFPAAAKNLVAEWQKAAMLRLKADAAARALLSESISAIGRSSSQ